MFTVFRLLERQSHREIYPLVHSWNAHNIQGWARSKPGAYNSIKVSHFGSRAWSMLLSIIHCLPECISFMLVWKCNSWYSNPPSNIGYMHTRVCLLYLYKDVHIYIYLHICMCISHVYIHTCTVPQSFPSDLPVNITFGFLEFMYIEQYYM